MKLENVRLSFPDLFKATQYQGAGPFMYRASLLVPAASPLKKAIDAEILRVATEKWGAKAKAILAANDGNPQKTCWIDGAKRPYDGYEGHWALSATRPEKKGRPLLYDAKKVLLDKDTGVLFGGCYVNASVNIWLQDNQHGKAARCELLGVQFAAKGDSFGGGMAPNPDDFEELTEGADAGDLA